MKETHRISVFVMERPGGDALAVKLSGNAEFAVVGFGLPDESALAEIRRTQPRLVVYRAEGTDAEAAATVKKIIASAPDATVVVAGSSATMAPAAGAAGAGGFVFFTGNAKRSFDDLLAKMKNVSGIAEQEVVAAKTAPLPAKTGFQTNFNGIIALGASCGGTQATTVVLEKLPANLPGMVVAQHMPPVFTKMYAETLNQACALEVREAEDGMSVRRGLVLIAPGDFQMRVVRLDGGYKVRVTREEKVSGHRPSVDVLFESVARAAGRNAVGILLTGMGSDGARGLLEMRKQGAFTIGQNEESSVVYGMPKVAFNMGAVQRQAHLELIPDVLLGHLSHK